MECGILVASGWERAINPSTGAQEVLHFFDGVVLLQRSGQMAFTDQMWLVGEQPPRPLPSEAPPVVHMESPARTSISPDWHESVRQWAQCRRPMYFPDPGDLTLPAPICSDPAAHPWQCQVQIELAARCLADVADFTMHAAVWRVDSAQLLRRLAGARRAGREVPPDVLATADDLIALAESMPLEPGMYLVAEVECHGASRLCALRLDAHLDDALWDARLYCMDGPLSLTRGAKLTRTILSLRPGLQVVKADVGRLRGFRHSRNKH